MSSKLDELRRRAEQAAREIDEKFEIKSKLDRGARATTDALRKGADGRLEVHSPPGEGTVVRANIPCASS